MRISDENQKCELSKYLQPEVFNHSLRFFVTYLQDLQVEKADAGEKSSADLYAYVAIPPDAAGALRPRPATYPVDCNLPNMPRDRTNLRYGKDK